MISPVFTREEAVALHDALSIFAETADEYRLIVAARALKSGRAKLATALIEDTDKEAAKCNGTSTRPPGRKQKNTSTS